VENNSPNPIALAIKKDKGRTLKLLIDFMDYFYGDIETLIFKLERILDTQEEEKQWTQGQ